MARVRLIADVEPELRRKVEETASMEGRSVSGFVEHAVRRELERGASERTWISAASGPAFRRVWDSEDDAAYDDVAK